MCLTVRVCVVYHAHTYGRVRTLDTPDTLQSLPDPGASPFPPFAPVPGPCDPEDLIDGIIFAASYLGSTHLLSERTPSKSARMQQAQEAMHRVRVSSGLVTAFNGVSG